MKPTKNYTMNTANASLPNCSNASPKKARIIAKIRRPTKLQEICATVEADEKEVIAIIERFRQTGRSFLMPPAGDDLTQNSLIDISHESLIRNWQRLKTWVEEESQSAQNVSPFGRVGRVISGRQSSPVARSRFTNRAEMAPSAINPTKTGHGATIPDLMMRLLLLKKVMKRAMLNWRHKK